MIMDAKKTQIRLRPLLVSASDVADILGIGKTLLWEMNSAGRLPRPIKLKRKTLWKLSELERWVEADCPPRDQWERIKVEHNS